MSAVPTRDTSEEDALDADPQTIACTKMLYAMLFRAIADARDPKLISAGCCGYGDSNVPHMQRMVLSWFRSDQTHVGSWRWLADMLNFDDGIRRAIEIYAIADVGKSDKSYQYGRHNKFGHRVNKPRSCGYR